MTTPRPTRGSRPSTRQTLFLFGLLFSVSVLSAVALLVPLPTALNAVPISLGEVSSEDILAPHNITYQSETLTEQQREIAASSVVVEYTPPDTNIARTQVNQLRAALTFIFSVRSDEFATSEQQLADLAALQSIHLSPEGAAQLLELSDSSWQSVQQEAITVLDQVMRSTIREDRLEDARRSVPALVSLYIPEDEAELVSELVSALVVPNSLYSETLTEEKRQAARDAVEPIIQSFKANETVVRRGHVITEIDLEALEELGLLQEQVTWKDRTSVISLVIVNVAFVALYFAQRPDLRDDSRGMLLMTVLFLVFLYGARIVAPNRTVIPYLFPVAGFGMIITALISSRAAMILSVPLSILSGYGLPDSLELILFYLFGSMFGILVLRNVQRILTFFWAGMAVWISGSAIILSFKLIDPTSDAVGILSLVGVAGFNGLAASALTIILQFILAQTIGLTTTLQLLDISRPDHPLLQLLLRNSPGTYQHSLQIANLAEQAANRIGANALLTRVGALYHDAGKARQPHFYIENQVPGSRNPHEELPALESSAIISRHVTDGVDLANKHRLPNRIKEFIREHHGTMITRYQYHTAVEAAGGDASKVNKEAYRYPGPRPQSRETALVMLADGVEARSRAERPETEEEFRALVKDVIDTRLKMGQLDDTPLTMSDLTTIIESFTTTLRGVYHPRIQYPKKDEDTQPAEGEFPEKNHDQSTDQ